MARGLQTKRLSVVTGEVTGHLTVIISTVQLAWLVFNSMAKNIRARCCSKQFNSPLEIID